LGSGKLNGERYSVEPTTYVGNDHRFVAAHGEFLTDRQCALQKKTGCIGGAERLHRWMFVGRQTHFWNTPHTLAWNIQRLTTRRNNLQIGAFFKQCRYQLCATLKQVIAVVQYQPTRKRADPVSEAIHDGSLKLPDLQRGGYSHGYGHWIIESIEPDEPHLGGTPA
jgi:hypothetical protein